MLDRLLESKVSFAETAQQNRQIAIGALITLFTKLKENKNDIKIVQEILREFKRELRNVRMDEKMFNNLNPLMKTAEKSFQNAVTYKRNKQNNKTRTEEWFEEALKETRSALNTIIDLIKPLLEQPVGNDDYRTFD